MNKHTARRKRHRAKAKLKFGSKAIRAHRRKGGRTGQVQSKRTPAKRFRYHFWRANPPGPIGMRLGI
jgi:hypothetical protein